MGDPIVQKALVAKRESRHVEFKETFDTSAKRDWCEIVKDLVALANSGGGVILFGVNSRGETTGADLTALRGLDPADVTNKIQPYTKTQFPDLEIHEVEKADVGLLAWVVQGADIPIVFSQPGTYGVEDGKQRTAFGHGTVYFRHGAKSEPGTTEDIARALERKLNAIRKEWLSGVRKVVHSAPGSRLSVLPPEVTESLAPGATPIRITDDPTAPAYRVVDSDTTHPFRQKELLKELRKRLPKSLTFNSFDIVCVRRAYRIDQRRDFIHLPKFGSRQYSPAFVEWVVTNLQSDSDFFLKARTQQQTGSE